VDRRNVGHRRSSSVAQTQRPQAKAVCLTNKVGLCEQSEPQSEPFVGQARSVQRWSKSTEKQGLTITDSASLIRLIWALVWNETIGY
jgi:hypothetical protein